MYYKFSRITLIFFLNLATFFFKVFIIWFFFLYFGVFKLTLNTKKITIATHKDDILMDLQQNVYQVYR